MPTTKVSAKMLTMLRDVAASGNSMGVPYRLGSINTARGLHDRGLIGMFHADSGGRRMYLSDAGRAYLASLDAPPTP